MQKDLITRCLLTLCAAGLVAGCGGTSATPSINPVGGFVSDAHVTFKNNSGRCAWMTAYWGYTYTGWYVATGQNANPRTLKPGEEWKFDIDYNNPVAGNQDIKIQAELSGPGGKCEGTGPKIDKAVKNLNDSGSHNSIDLSGSLTDGNAGAVNIGLYVTHRD